MTLTISKIALDRTGFPMIRLDEFECYVNLYPITKIQFEYFLCDRVASRGFNEAWYLERLAANQRCSPLQVTNENFEQAFMTGLLPETETNAFGKWLFGKEFLARIPDVHEWHAIYTNCASELPIPNSDFDEVDGINPRALDLIKTLDARSSGGFANKSPFINRPQTTNEINRMLTHQMLLEGGMSEWVKEGNNWGAKGGAIPRLGGQHGNPLTEGLRQLNQHETRPHNVGIRFIIQAK